MTFRHTALTFLLIWQGAAAQAAPEWGYEDAVSPAVAEPAPRVSPTAKGVPERSLRSGKESPDPVKVTNPKQEALNSWQELYNFVSLNGLSEDQKERVSRHLTAKLEAGQTADVLGILKFWPLLSKQMRSNALQEESYKDLLRALLRLQYRSNPNTGAQSDGDLLAEVLGPQRVAVAGSPPLTEDAINAYADMACFLYEQKNPGRTLDATDNRTVFARVISDKFKDAPTSKDKLAMVNFDINWAKFKVQWTGADALQRKRLLEQWTAEKDASAKAKVGAPQAQPVLEAVLANGPWSKHLLPVSASGLKSQPQPAASKPNSARMPRK